MLVVGTDPSALQLIGLTLECAGHQVWTFEQVSRALELLERTPPDLLIAAADLLPNGGLELLHLLRSDARWARIPFVLLAPGADAAAMRAAMLLGADDVLTTLSPPETLLQTVEVRLQRVRELRGEAGAAQVRVRAMGRAEVLWRGVPVVWNSRKAAELFFFLLEKGGSSSWEAAEALWPEKDEEKASSLFHTTLHRLRRSLAPEAITQANRRYGLSEALRLRYDVQEYRRRAREALDADEIGLLDGAIALHGDFLPGFESDWCEEVRAELGAIQVELLRRAAALHEPERPQLAARYSEQAVRIDPLDERNWRDLERLLNRLEDPRSRAAARRIPWWG